MKLIAVMLALVVVALAGCSNETRIVPPASDRTPTTTHSTPQPTLAAGEPSSTAISATPLAALGSTACSSIEVLAPIGTAAAFVEYVPLPSQPDQALEDVIRQSLGTEIEHFGIVVKNLDDGSGIMVDADRVFYGASLYKVWAMLEIFRQQEHGLFDLNEEYLVTEYYAGLGLNAGELEPCTMVTARRALEAMMSISDNVAARMLLDRVGIGNLNSGLRTLGLPLSGFSEDGPEVTARETALLFESIGIGAMLSPSAHEEMMSLLVSERVANRLPALLPVGTVVAHKTGSWENATHDAGIVVSPNATYVVVVLSDYGFTVDGASVIAQLSRDIYDYYNGQ